MATSISTSFSSLYLTSHLPADVLISTDAVCLTVCLYVDDNRVFSSIYYPFEGVVQVSDIRSIVEGYMLSEGLQMATLKVEAIEPASSSSAVTYDEYGNLNIDFNEQEENAVTAYVDNITLIFCEFKVQRTASVFLQQSFLTTRKSALIKRNGQVVLKHYKETGGREVKTVKIYYVLATNPEENKTYNHTLGTLDYQVHGLITTTLTYAFLKGVVDSYEGGSCSVLGATLTIGSRSFSVFFTDEAPTDSFEFRSAFNQLEALDLYGATTVKTEVSRSEAICGRVTQFYDETVKVKHEVETAVLSYNEAQWITQMLTSKHVFRILSNGQSVPILISDISSEVTNSNKEQIHLKFTWTFADDNEWLY